MRFALIAAVVLAAALPARAVDFDRDVRPVLAEHCFGCHGADAKRREAKLRLDEKQGLFELLDSGRRAVVPGDLARSELWRRIASHDDDVRMPPPDVERRPSEAELAAVRRWILSGAKWKPHWAYVAPKRAPRPHVAQKNWPAGEFDYFTLARMEQAGLSPSPPAGKEELLRRATFDLTGLPPTPEEITAFLADESPDAFERVIDRLLKSPRYGERMALAWLDLARYADTHGYSIDSHRDMWRWRQWVIDAFNDNLPYDRFTVWQLAGDLLPQPTLEQRIATGFNRNHMINFEGGAIAEEYRTEYVADRVATTATVWLGQTFECARCHDHKYDPLSQRDYYRMFAYFNNVSEQGIDGQQGNAVPFISAPTRPQQRELDRLSGEIAELSRQMKQRAKQAAAGQRAWEASVVAQTRGREPAPRDAVMYLPLDDDEGSKCINRTGDGHGDIEGTVRRATGKFGGGLLLDGGVRIVLKENPVVGKPEFTASAWVFPTTTDDATVIAGKGAGGEWRGFATRPARVRVRTKTEERETNERLPTSTWTHVAVVVKADGAVVYLNGRAAEEMKAAVEEGAADGTGSEAAALVIGEGFRGKIDEVQLFARSLTAAQAAALAAAQPVRDIALIPEDKRTEEESAQLREYFLVHHDDAYGKLFAQHRTARRRREDLLREVPTVMVMEEMDAPRETHILHRGDYRRIGPRVSPGTPSFLPPLTANNNDRLALARWLVDPSHPLTARVAVNRFWQMLFGQGLVRTPGDFGVRGTPPTHPELLDNLALDFVESGWDVKRLLKRIMLSSTYRQASRMTPQRLRSDPENLLLARFPRTPLPAEAVRDSALFSAGLLAERLGGPSVFPYQPLGLWKEVSYDPDLYTAQIYVESLGDDLYRRSMYTFWKRTVPPPSLEVFGAPNRETCTVLRPVAITPLQALTRMNDPTYVEASRAIAERVMQQAGPSVDARVDYAFRLVLSRLPTAAERAVLRNIYQEQLADFRKNPAAAAALLTAGESPRSRVLAPVQVASWAVAASTLLNLDEAVMK